MVGEQAGAFGLAVAGGTARIGRYEVFQRLAVGGMAELFLARSVGIEGFQKQVVIKRMLPQYARHPQMVTMFLDEARLAARLHHPNIAQVFDIGEASGEYFFTMEFVRGEDLGAVLRTCYHSGIEFPLEHAVNVAMGAAAGLQHAHRLRDEEGRGLKIVHRDVSPSNIMIAYDGSVKLVDFGIAKARTRSHTTSSGGIKGKFAYMSPEQCRGDPLDRRSDIFSLGIVLYEMTTGMQLFGAETPMKARQLIEDGEFAPPSHARANYPSELEDIVMRALRYDPSERYQMASELQMELETFARENKLAVSNIGLGSFMRHLFDRELSEEERTLYETMADHVSLEVPGLGSRTRNTEAGTAAPLPAGYPAGTSAPEMRGYAPMVPPLSMQSASGGTPSYGQVGASYSSSPSSVNRRTEAMPGAPASQTYYPPSPHFVHTPPVHHLTTSVPAPSSQSSSMFTGLVGVLLGLAIGLGGAAFAGYQLGWFGKRVERAARVESPPAPVEAATAPSGAVQAPTPTVEPSAAASMQPAAVIPGAQPVGDGAALRVGQEARESQGQGRDLEVRVEPNSSDSRATVEGSDASNDARPKRARSEGSSRSRSRDRKGRTKGKTDEKRNEDTTRSWDLDSPLPPGG